MLTRKSSRSWIFLPSFKGSNADQTLNPKIHGMDKTPTTTILTIAAFLLLHPHKSIPKDIIFSNTARIVENAAKDINAKNKLPQSLPPGISLKIFGRVIKISPGPLSGFTPYAKHAGNMINPAVMATKVSNTATLIDSPNKERDFPM